MKAITKATKGTPATLIGGWLAGRSEASRRAYAVALERAARVVGRSVEAVDWVRLTPAELGSIREELISSGQSPATVNLTMSAVRSLVRHAWHERLITHEQRARLEDVPGARGSRLPAGRHVGGHELAAIAKACARDGSVVGLRDVAVIALAATTGMRRAELVALDVSDFHPETGRIVVRGKGNKQRAIFATNGALDALRDWLRSRGDFAGPLFVRLVRKPGRTHEITDRRLTAESVEDIITRRAREAGLDPVHPHDLRRTVAGELLDQGTDLATVARLLGHADVRTTARYDRRPEAAVAQAAAKIRFPYRPASAGGGRLSRPVPGLS